MLERWSAAPFRPTNAPEDRPLWDAFHRYRRARAAERSPGEPVESDAVVEHRLLRVRDDLLHHRYAVIAGDAIVSFADFAVARPDSPSFEARRRTLQLDIGVLRPYRRRDIATNWLSLAVEAMNLHGASQVVGAVSETDGHGFARWLGAEVERIDQEAICAVATIDSRSLAAWRDAAQARGIDVETLVGPLDTDERRRYAGVARELAAALGTEQAGAPEAEDPLIALDRLQGLLDVAGGRHIVAMARDAEGEGLGIADAIWSPDAPARADLLSVALRAVRHDRTDTAPDLEAMLRLARGLKAGLIETILGALPEVETLRAAHRGADEALLAIDDEIGFRTHRIITTYRLAHAPLVAKLEAVGLS